MEISLLTATVAAVALVAPFVLVAYIQRLPVAPTCPNCRAVTRESDPRWLAAQVLAVLPITFLGECTRCGWRGRMRWRWATRSVDRRDGG